MQVRWGVVLLDKPAGTTSRRAADRVRALLGAPKAGHGGTLDPAVTGVLPVLLAKATRAAGVLLGCDKAYEGLMVLHGDVSDEQLEAGMEHFRGVIEQTPPRRSRVKRVARRRAVHLFEVTERRGRAAEFAVGCQGGTYVRKLVHDLGEVLGCGAHMARLRRTQAGPFTLEECARMDEVERAADDLARGRLESLAPLVRPVEEALARLLPRLWVDDGAVDPVCSGAELAVPGICELDEFRRDDAVMVLTLKGELVGIGRALRDAAQVAKADRGAAVAVHTVLMARGIYPSRSAGRCERPPGPQGGSA
jgi:H/ACA ribonucleoprotein complex subunit 4